MTDPVIDVDIARYRYPGTETDALHDVHLQVQPGEYVGVIGLNGAGKTTLGLCLNGVVPTMLGGDLDGVVRVAGMDVADYPVREMSKLVGVVFDNPEFQMSQMSVAEEVALGLENSAVSYEDMTRIIPQTLDLVGLAGYEERSPLGLSGGQQQRLAIAAVLAMAPSILVMDEPTSNLDPIGKQEVFEIAARLNRENGMTVVVIEHEVEVLAQYADRVLVMHEGTIVLNGPPSDVLARVEELRALGLRTPEAATLAHELAADGLWSGPLPTLEDDAVAGVLQMIGTAR